MYPLSDTARPENPVKLPPLESCPYQEELESPKGVMTYVAIFVNAIGYFTVIHLPVPALPPCLYAYRNPRYSAIIINTSIPKSCIGGFIRLAIPSAV